MQNFEVIIIFNSNAFSLYSVWFWYIQDSYLERK